jgi:RimJ/RimL family protein N-acetyltransferase
MVTVPTLTTERLILRAHTVNDYETLHAMWSDPEVTRFIGGRASSLQDSWFRLMRYLGHWQMLGFGYFALCERESGAHVGDVGIANHKRGIHPDFDEAPETGWVLSPDAFGKGYATEAMTAVLNWFEATHAKQTSVCMIQMGNEPSMKVARKLGYNVFTQVQMGDASLNLLSRP